MPVDRRDLGAGATFLAVAVIYGGIAWNSLPIGLALSMGPGYFPLVLSGLIGLVGLALMIRGVASGAGAPFFEDFSWRGLVLVSLAVVLFGNFVRELGLFLAVIVVTLLCASASRSFRPLESVLLSLGLASLCALVFGVGVRLPIPLIGSWIGG